MRRNFCPLPFNQARHRSLTRWLGRRGALFVSFLGQASVKYLLWFFGAGLNRNGVIHETLIVLLENEPTPVIRWHLPDCKLGGRSSCRLGSGLQGFPAIQVHNRRNCLGILPGPRRQPVRHDRDGKHLLTIHYALESAGLVCCLGLRQAPVQLKTCAMHHG